MRFPPHARAKAFRFSDASSQMIALVVVALSFALAMLGGCAEKRQTSGAESSPSASARFVVSDSTVPLGSSSAAEASASSNSASTQNTSAESADASSGTDGSGARADSKDEGGGSANLTDSESAGEGNDESEADSADEPDSSAGDSGDGVDDPDASADPDASGDPDASSSGLPELDIVEDYRDSFVHGDKGAEFQKYIVLHDTEGEGDAASVINSWDNAGSGVAAHFIVNTDGSVWQCVPLDKIAHHAGYGDTGHNEQYGVEDESRDDFAGTMPIGDWAADYGMNSHSVGIEMVHVGGSGYYPEEQLAAVDALVAYIDAYYGFESQIIDHKAWRSGNSDTSPEFADFLANYQDHRTHD